MFATGEGTATITGTTRDGSKKTVTSQVTVNKKVDVDGVKLKPAKATLKVGQTKTLTATVKPKKAANQNVEWYTTNESVATVDQNGKVTARKAGDAIILVVTEEGSHADVCRVTVTN